MSSTHVACRNVGIAICALLLGLPGLAFFTILTYGFILAPLVGLAFIAPFVLLNYLVWGWHGAFRPARRPCNACDETC